MEVFVRDNDVNAAPRVEEKDAARGHVSRNEVAPLLREAIGTACSRKSRVGPPLPKDAAEAPGRGGILI